MVKDIYALCKDKDIYVKDIYALYFSRGDPD